MSRHHHLRIDGNIAQQQQARILSPTLGNKFETWWHHAGDNPLQATQGDCKMKKRKTHHRLILRQCIS
jgi:hypothetical protein